MNKIARKGHINLKYKIKATMYIEHKFLLLKN